MRPQRPAQGLREGISWQEPPFHSLARGNFGGHAFPRPKGADLFVFFAGKVDFAPNNKLVNWYVGGLNYQAVHHLFPKVCHVHYPALSKIVAEVAAQFGVPYRVNPTFFGILGSHLRWLHEMGRAPVPVSQTELSAA